MNNKKLQQVTNMLTNQDMTKFNVESLFVREANMLKNKTKSSYEEINSEDYFLILVKIINLFLKGALKINVS